MNRTFSPRSLDEALEYLAGEASLKLMAGCTDFLVAHPPRPGESVDYMNVLNIPEILGIHEEGDHLRIGAGTTFADIRQSSVVQERYPILAEAASMVGALQIQNRATLGGNIVNASPAGDSLPVLLALDAVAVAASGDGLREIPYADFHIGYRQTALEPGEMLAWIMLPPPPPERIQHFRKVGTRRAQAISKVAVAFVAERADGRLENVRIAAGSVAATPVRLRMAEKVCEGKKLGPELAEAIAKAAMGEVQPIDDVRSTAEYRRWVLGRVIRRMILRSL